MADVNGTTKTLVQIRLREVLEDNRAGEVPEEISRIDAGRGR
jgi:hypothetical protein